MRFDKKSTHKEHLQNDKFTLVSEVWIRFIDNCQSCYKPGEYSTIDEQLFPTKTRFKCSQFMALKPDNYGIKFLLAIDIQ